MSGFVQVKRLRTIGELRDRLVVLGADERVGADETVDPAGRDSTVMAIPQVGRVGPWSPPKTRWHGPSRAPRP